MQSLQSKLMLWIGGSIAALLVVAGLVLYFAVRSTLLDQFDQSLDRTARTLAFMIETTGERVQSEMVEEELPQFATVINPEYYQIFDAENQTLESSSRLENRSLPVVVPQDQETVFEFFTLPDGRAGRLAAIKFIPRYEPPDEHEKYEGQNHEEENEEREEGQVPETESRSGSRRPEGNDRREAMIDSPVTLVVARTTADLDNSLARIGWLIAIVTLVAIGFGLLIAAMVARWGLRPLRSATKDISRIDGKHLDIRLNLDNAPSEVQPTMVALNQMLDRLKETFQREREFAANVAHELRTPLAGIKSTIEVAISRHRDSTEYEAAFNDCLMICKETEAIINNLFTLSRVDSGNCVVTTEQVDLGELIRDTWQPFGPVATDRDIAIRWDVDESIRLSSDPEKLLLVFRNLFDNAVAYSEDGSTMDVICQQRDKMATVQVINPAVNLKAADVPKVFERFWRSDRSRSQTGQHSGLGLALCRSLVDLLGGQIEAKLTNDDRFIVQVDLPLSLGNFHTTDKPSGVFQPR